LLLGYTDEALNRQQFDGDGWFSPGDRGIVSEDRWIRITGRTKDIVNRGGEKFSSLDIENVLDGHPGLAEVAVIPVPDERMGESVCAFVVPSPGGEPPTPKALCAYMLDRGVARVKIPTEWHIIDALPRTSSGKVQKYLLRAWRDNL